MDVNINAGNNTTTVNVKEFAARFRSKYEIYQFLTMECSYYLPIYD